VKKGIILAGGKGSRLHPVTISMGKPLLPVYDKPLVYYPLSTLLELGIKDILLITTERDIPLFEQLLGDGKELGITLQYAVQAEPKGIPDAFIIGEKFIGTDSVALVLGDNIFHPVKQIKESAEKFKSGAMIFALPVNNPSDFGVIDLSKSGKIMSLEEKPEDHKSDLAVVGLYLFDNNIVEIAKRLKPSKRGELEILDPIRVYLKQKKVKYINLGDEFNWFDAGSADTLAEAGEFIKFAERQIEQKIGSVELVALKQGFIGDKQFVSLVEKMPECSYKSALISYCEKL
jgi:glucose-1-phosphate thymidylyltransferase